MSSLFCKLHQMTAESLFSLSCLHCAADGQVYTWGKSQRGRLGREAEEPTYEPKMILFEGMQTVMSLSTSHGITLLLTRVTAAAS